MSEKVKPKWPPLECVGIVILAIYLIGCIECLFGVVCGVQSLILPGVCTTGIAILMLTAFGYQVRRNWAEFDSTEEPEKFFQGANE